MANRYRRFIAGALEYAQLLEIADALNRRGVKARIEWDIFDHGGLKETVHFLDIEACYTQVSTQGLVHFIQTGQVQPLDGQVDQVLMEFLEKYPGYDVTCSHCYSHTYDNSDVEGAWAPNPSGSCMMSQSAAMQKEAV